MNQGYGMSTLSERDGQRAAIVVGRATRVLIVDDHQTFAQLLALAVSSQPDFECVGTAGTGAEALRLATQLMPDLVVMDIELDQESGLDVTRKLREAVPSLVVVVVTAHRDADWVVRAAQAGANAFAPKSGALDEMLTILRGARSGAMTVASSMFAATPFRQPSADPGAASLTAREREVLTLLGKGVAPVAVARMLGITVNTARGYVKSIHAKLGVRSQLEAVLKAQRLGIIETSDDA
jgi:DNA-binding NarL/FixJ family response regulator